MEQAEAAARLKITQILEALDRADEYRRQIKTFTVSV
jgi:hypothetical protein